MGRENGRQDGISDSINQGTFVYGLFKGRTVHHMAYLQSIGRLYGPSIVRQKATRFIYGPLEGCIVYLQTVSRTYGQLKAPSGRRPKRHFGGISYAFPLYFIVLFLRIPFIFYGFIFIYFAFYSFIKANYKGYIHVVLFLVPLVYNYSIAPTIRRNFLCISFVFYSFISYIFLLYFTVLLKQLRTLYTSGFIF